jgi:hypothetical protein
MRVVLMRVWKEKKEWKRIKDYAILYSLATKFNKSFSCLHVLGYALGVFQYNLALKIEPFSMFTFRSVIRNNSCVWDASAEEKERVLAKMIKEVWAVFFHNIRPEQPLKSKGKGVRKYRAIDFLDSTGSPKEGYRITCPADQHRFCPATWCKFQPQKYLDPVFRESLFTIWQKLTKREFLKRLVYILYIGGSWKYY